MKIKESGEHDDIESQPHRLQNELKKLPQRHDGRVSQELRAISQSRNNRKQTLGLRDKPEDRTMARGEDDEQSQEGQPSCEKGR